MKIYLAGGLFNAPERLHNLYLEKHLKELGHEVILPQREALRFFDGEHFDMYKIAETCAQSCADKEIFYVGNADGADTDSGTAVEYGIAITATHRALVYRTDFRTDETRELGVNAMFKLRGTVFVYFPCQITNLGQVEEYYQNLARYIHEALFALAKGPDAYRAFRQLERSFSPNFKYRHED